MIVQHKRILFLIGMLLLFLGTLLFLRFRYFDETFSLRSSYREGDTSPNISGIYKWTADTSLYHFTSTEGRMPTRSDFFQKDFLSHFPVKIGEWEGENISNQYADISLFRLYRHPRSRENVWLIAVYGSHQSQFHSAEVCYISDGWDVARREIKRVQSDKDSFPIRYFIAEKGENIHLVSYWYIWPSPKREVSEGTLLFRISVEGDVSEEKAESVLIDFMEGLLNLTVTGKQPKTIVSAKRILPPSSLPPVVAKVDRKHPKNSGTNHPFVDAKEKVIAWILEQRVPNAIVRLPQIDRRYLLLSYELNRDHPKTENDKSYRYIFSRSAIYDNAIGLIALSQAGYFREAEAIIDAFERVIQGDGRFWFSYNTHDDWPSKWNHDEAIIRNGASAWAGYAITYHLRRRLLEDPEILNRDENLKHYVKMAKTIADAILEDQVLDSKDLRYGLVTGGEGAHAMVKDEKTNRVIEKFHAGKVEWASVEHNLDIFFLLKNLWILTGEKKYKEAAALMKEALEARAWNKGEGQYNRGVRKGDIDT
ncbi:MAG: exosortase-associated EpsI family protein, partial [Deltaproteobacteria bacterium]